MSDAWLLQAVYEGVYDCDQQTGIMEMSHLRNVLLTLLVFMVALGEAGCIPQTDGEKAQDVLTRYFALLHQGKYTEAVELYGGEYDMLAESNPTVPPNEHAKLLELGCTINGLQCLPLKTIGSREDSAPDLFEFIVQFEDPDGGVFVQESLDASATGPRFESDFKFTVFKREGNFLVRELPVYSP